MAKAQITQSYKAQRLELVQDVMQPYQLFLIVIFNAELMDIHKTIPYTEPMKQGIVYLRGMKRDE
jgi:hypothetical protein